MNTKELNYNNNELPKESMYEYILKEQKRLKHMDPWERRKLAEEIAVSS